MAQRQTSGTHFPPGEALPVGYPLRGVQEERGGGGEAEGVKVHGMWGMVVIGAGWGEWRGGGSCKLIVRTRGVDDKQNLTNCLRA